MTRFEDAAQSPTNMSVVVAFCIAGYLEAIGIQKFSDKELIEFMQITSDDIEKWLKEEM